MNTPMTGENPNPPLADAIGSAIAIQIETLEYAAHLCKMCNGLSVQVQWKIEAIIERLSQPNAAPEPGGE